MKTGLVIQGPIISDGFGPFEFKSDGSYQKDWVSYDSRDNILRTIESAIEHFDFVVLATWKSLENQTFISNLSQIENLHIVELEENTFLKERAANGCHKYHQIFTTRAGAAKLNQLGASLMSKCRTDHTLNMALVFAATIKHEKYNYYSLGVPYLNLFEPDRLTDFYLIGNTKVIEELCDFYLSQSELFVDVHKDYFFRFANYLGLKSSFEKLSNSSIREPSSFLAAIAWSKVFYPMDFRILEDFYWRGRKVDSRLNAWVRWFFVFHSTSKMDSTIKALMNYVMLGLIRALKKPFIRLSSWILFHKLSKKAASESFLV